LIFAQSSLVQVSLIASMEINRVNCFHHRQ
jgi:hypothetical protein